MKTIWFYVFVVLFVIGCGGESSTPKEGGSNLGELPRSENTEIGIIGEDLTSPEATFKKIGEIPEFSKVHLPWLSGEWASYSVPRLGIEDSIISFKSDGTYPYKDITLLKKSKNEQRGQYTIFKHVSSKWFVLLLTSTQHSVVNSYILEKEDDNSFRLINKYKKPALGTNFLYTRLDSKTPAIYPGMYFLGTYQYTDHTDTIGGSYKNVYQYQFNADNTLIKKHYYDVALHDFELRSTKEGTWKINQDTFQLELRVES